MTASLVAGDTGTSMGDRSGEGATPFTGLAQAPEANLFTGALTTRISIKVPPGRKGMTPELALQYSSAGGAGAFGHGWDLPIGHIERSTKWGVPRCTGDHVDDFVLVMPNNGAVELVRDSPGHSVFRPVVEAAWLEADFNAGANRWTVRDRSGMRYTFGDHSSARISTFPDAPALTLNPDGSCQLTSAWMLTRVEDTNGNTIDVEWLMTENVPLPSRVLYGGNSNGLEHFYRVQFHYLLRPPSDFLTSHRLGVEQRSVMRLQVATVYTDIPTPNRSVRSYEFHYFDDGITHSMLNAVTASGEPTQTFVYTPTGTGHATMAQAIAVSVPPDHTYMRAWTSSLEVHYSIIDMNGDGKLDLVKGGWFPWTVHFGENDGGEDFRFSTSPVQWSGNSNYSEGRIRNVWITTGPCDDNGWACTTVDTFDITGDGRVDYVVATDAGQPWRVHTGERKSDGSWGFSENPISWAAPDRFIRRIRSGHTYRDTIDVNGDGLPDLVDVVAGQWQVWLNHGLGFEAEPLPYFPAPVESIGYQSGGSSGSTAYMVADFDGDGLADLLQHVNADEDDHCDEFPSSGGQTEQRHDCLLVFRNTGQGFAATPDVMALPLWASGVTMQSNGEVIADLVDINGDGLPDWVERSSDGLTWKVLLNLAGSLAPVGFAPAAPHDAVATTVWPGGQGPLRKTSGRRTEIDLVDLNGDGFLDRVVAGGLAWDVQLNLLTQKPKLLWMMENGMGGTNTIVYEPSTRFDHSGGDEQPDMPFVSWVVAATRLNDGLCTPSAGANVFDRAENPCIDQGHELVSFFDYQDGRLDLDYDYDGNGTPIAVADRGFHGYRRVTRTDIDGNETVSVFGQGPLVRGRLLELYYHAGDTETGALVRYETNQWSSRPASGARDQVWLERNARVTFDLGGNPHLVVTTNHSVDEYGNVLHTSARGNAMPVVDTFTEYAVAFGSNDSFPRNRPRQTTTQAATGVLDRRLFHYDSAPAGTLSKGNLTAVLTWLDTESRWVTTSYGYDGYGNLISSRNGKGVETTFEYDDGTGTLLYPVVETNGIGHQTATVMDYRHGKPAVAWGANGIATATVFQYDAAGRPTCEARPGDTVASCTIATTYEFAQSPGQHSKVTVARKQSGYASSRTTTTHLDALGRVRYADVQAVVNGSVVTVRRDRSEYDAGGRLREKFYPYPATATAPSNGSTSFDYRLNGSAAVDPLGRVNRISHADGSFTSSLYQGERVVSHDEEGNRTDRVYDALERVVREEAHIGGTVYSSTRSVYDGMGRLVALYQNGDSLPTKSFVYDTLGRRISVTDRDSGTWRYGYDDAGNLAYRDDPKVGQHTQYCYDDADRPQRVCGLAEDFHVLYPCAQSCSDDERVHTYDDPAVPFSKGRLTTVSDEAGRFRVLGYDQRGRQLTTEREIEVDGAVTTGRFEYEYNDTDEVVQIRYPDGEVVTTNYDQAGQPTSLQSDTGTVYVSAVWYDVFGRANTIWHGNGTRDDRHYYGAANRHRLSTIATLTAQDFALAQVYEYTPRGKIAAIFDFDPSPRSNGALYHYDVLGRLTNFDSFQDQLDRTYQYDARGNITRKGSLNFSYGNAASPGVRPHQMIAVNGVAVGHDANGNRTGSHTGSQTYSYDAEDRLETVSLASKNIDFLYDYAGERRARIVTAGAATKVTRYYSDLLHTTAAGAAVKSYFLGGMRVASRTNSDTTWEMASAAAGPIQVASGWHGRPFLLLEVDSRVQLAAAVGTLLLFITIAAAPGRRRTRVVGLRVRRGQAAALAVVFAIAASPWPVVVRPASAQCGGPPPGGPIAHYHVDHLGSTQVITNASGAVVEHLRYMPFGELRGRWNGAGDPIGGPAVDQVTFDYTGHERELSSGLIYAKARFYDPVLGTFLTPDPAGEFTSPYAYAGWDPVNGNDPTGKFVSIGLLIASFVIGFAVAAIDAALAGANLTDALKAGLIGGATSLVSAAVLGPVNGALSGLDGWARAAADAVRLAGGGAGIYNTVEAFRNGEYLAGSRGVLQIVSAAFGGLRQSNVGVGAKESRMPVGFSLGQNTSAPEPRGSRMGPVADLFPARPGSGTAATVRVSSVTVFGIKIEVGTAWAIDSAGNTQIFDTFAVGLEIEVFEISGVQGFNLTDAASVADLGGRSTSIGGTGGPSGIGFGAEYTVAPSYSGVTFYGGVQFGIAPVGAYGMREHWSPRGP
jgi:RHS repeat-associated protein